MTVSPNTALTRLFMNGRSVHARKGEVIARGDDEDSWVYLIEKGFVKVYSINDDGEEYLHIIYKAGDLFPLIWAFRDARRRVFYEALSSSVLWKLPKDRFVAAVYENSSPINRSLIEQLSEQFHVYADRLDNLQYKSAHERVVFRLLFLASRFGRKKGREIVIEAPLSHKLIAQSVNLTRESVSREIEKLIELGLVRTDNGKIVINDVKRLSEQFSEPVTIDLWGLQ